MTVWGSLATVAKQKKHQAPLDASSLSACWPVPKDWNLPEARAWSTLSHQLYAMDGAKNSNKPSTVQLYWTLLVQGNMKNKGISLAKGEASHVSDLRKPC